MSDLTDDTKLNCAGEFITACENPHQLSQAVELLALLLNGERSHAEACFASLEYVENISDALVYSIEQAKDHYKDIDNEQSRTTLQEEVLTQILEFSHAYLAKAYEKKVGRA